MKLLVLDVEGTLFRTDIRLPGALIDSTIWQAIAHALGPDAIREEVATHRNWENKVYNSYIDWMKATIAIHLRYGLSRDLFQGLVSSAEYNPGVMDTLSSLDRTKYEPVLVSGGFRELASRAQRDLRIYHAFAACEYLFGKDGKLLSYNLLPCDFEGKIDFIKLMLHEYQLGVDAWTFVGDGANDIAVAKEAPVSVGYRPHPDLKNVVSYVIEDFHELPNVLEIADIDQRQAPYAGKC